MDSTGNARSGLDGLGGESGGGETSQPPAEPLWVIHEEGFDPGCAKAWEGLFTLGNGGLHLRGALEEGLLTAPQGERYLRLPANVTSEKFRHPVSRWGTFVPGVYAAHPLLNTELVNLPWFAGFAIEVDGRRVDLSSAEPVSHRRSLHLREATLERFTTFGLGDGRRLHLAAERFVATGAAHPRLVGQRLILAVAGKADPAVASSTLRVLACTDADVTTNGFDHFDHVEHHAEPRTGAAGEGVLLSTRVRTDAGDEVVIQSFISARAYHRIADAVDAGAEAARMLREPGLAGEATAVDGLQWEPCAVSGDGRRAACGIVLPLADESGSAATLVIERWTNVEVAESSTASGRQRRSPNWWRTETPATPGDRASQPGGTLNYAAVRAAHVAAWEGRWHDADVVIEGDPDAQQALRASLYHLLRAHPGPGARLSIDAKAYAGEAYWGRFFWDTEMFLLPFFAAVDPDLGRSLVEFRTATLAGARANAGGYGYAGARYAWESDHRGRECCPNWQYADHEVHVTADVTYGLAYHAIASGEDQGFLLRPDVAETILETARYWLDRVEVEPAIDASTSDPATFRVWLRGVMGPDEYTPIANNNAYTNRLARFNLQLAARIIEAKGGDPAEARQMDRVGAALPIPRHPSHSHLVLQCDGFDQLADPRFERFWRDRQRTFASQVSQERLYRSQALKQADVLMLMWLFPDEFTLEELAAAWDYYVPRTTHDSSLSPGVHALIAHRLGRREDAWQYWRRAARIDLDVAQGGAAEGIHIANAAASWMGVIFGFAGVSTPPVAKVAESSWWRERTAAPGGRGGGDHEEVAASAGAESDLAASAPLLKLRPSLPRHWERLRFPLRFRGRRLAIEVAPSQVVVRNLSDASAVRVQVGQGVPVTLEPGASCDLTY